MCVWGNNAGAILLLLGLATAPVALARDCPPPAPPRAITPVDGAWSVATQNLWRLLDEQGQAGADTPPSAAQVAARIDALAGYIDQRLAYPHLLLVQEVENRALLARLARVIESRGGPRYDVWLMEGQDPSGIDVGALSRPPVRVQRMAALFAGARLDVHWLFSRPPLHLTLAEPLEMDVLVLHLRSGRGLHDPDTGARVRAKRRAQADRVASWVSAQRAAGRRVLVAGDINSAPRTGVFAEPLETLLEAPLVSAWEQLPANEQFSYVYRCQPQAIDHLLVTDNLLPMLKAVQVSRGNAGRFRALHQSGGTRVVSDHDSLVVWFVSGEQVTEAVGQAGE